MVSYKPYPGYRSSRVEWLGDIPAHWRETKLKFIGDLILGLTYSPNDVVSESDDGTLVLRSSNVQSGKIELNDCVYVSNSIPKKLITTERDILICSRNGSRALIGKCAVIDEHVCGQTFGAFMTVFRTQFTKFVYYILNSSLFKFQSGRFLTSTINQLTTETLGGFEIPLPPANEQHAIVRFLDFKTTQIDALISKKQILLEKLAEKRTALISHAVTKGLDPSVPMKNSGVKWLGKIPMHWAAKRLKFLGKTRYGLGEPPQKLDGGLPFIRATDIYRGEIDGSKVQTVDPDCVPWLRNPALRTKDILIVRSGAYTGDSAIVPAHWEGSIAGYDMIYTAEDALPEYVAFNLLSKHVLNGQIYLAKNRAAQPHLNAEELGGVVIALPPPEEQVEIIAYLERYNKYLAVQFELVNGVIDRLHEYRSSLITNAVTGKIDVRGFQLPSDNAAKENADA